MTRSLLFVLPFAIAFAALLFGADEKKKPEPKTIAKVLDVKLAMTKKLPPDLLITAVGEVPTGGYTSPTLDPYVYVKEPEDGIQDFNFTAVPPDGPAIQVISKVEAKATIKDLPKWIKGVRIHGAGDGVVVKMIGGK